jgi:xanthine dehydrogenase accessory factor
VDSSARGVLLFERVAPGQGIWSRAATRPGETWVAAVCAEGSYDRLLVSSRDTLGELSPGRLETWAIREARSLLAEEARGAVILTAPTGTAVLYDVIRPPDLRVAVFGSGDVGRAIIGVLGVLPCEVLWIDDREELLADPAFQNTEVRLTDRPELEADRIDPGTCCIVTTYSHELDRRICDRLLARDDLPFVGLIGSRKKRKSFEEHWREDGMEPERMSRLVCPLGDARIKGRSPGEIAVAVVAQLLITQE